MGQPGPPHVPAGRVILRNPAEVKLDTHRTRLGDIPKLAVQMRKAGTVPYPPAALPTADGRWEILLGGRRYLAQQQLGGLVQPLVEVSSWSDLLAWMGRDRDETMPTHDRKPTTLSEAGRLIEKITERFSLGVRARADQVISEYLDLKPKDVQHVRSVGRNFISADVPAEVRRYALDQIRDANAGKIAAHTAYQRTKAFADSKAKADRPGLPAADLRRRFAAAGPMLSGAVTGLSDLGAIHPDITAEELATYIEVLSASRAGLERIIKTLRAAQEERAQ